jgi:hypothetical protein
VIVLIVDHFCVSADKSKGDSPIAANRNCPGTFACALERVKPKARKAHVVRLGRGAKTTQDQTQALRILGLNPGLRPGLKELGQPLMLEASDHEA